MSRCPHPSSLNRRHLLRFAAFGLTCPAWLSRPAYAAGDEWYRIIGWSDYFGAGDDIVYLDSDVGAHIGGDFRVARDGADRIETWDAFGSRLRSYDRDGRSYDAVLDGLPLLVEPETPFGPVPDWLQLPRGRLEPFVAPPVEGGSGFEILLLAGDRAVFLNDMYNVRGTGYGSTTIAARFSSATLNAITAGAPLPG